jgi:hypothetical protein
MQFQNALGLIALLLLLCSAGLSICAVLFLFGQAWAMLAGAAWCLVLSITLLRSLSDG